MKLRSVRAITLAALGFALALGSACGVGQSAECQRYLACQAHYDELFNREPPNTNLYQPDGVCWESDELADECSAACDRLTENLIERLVEEDASLGACEP